MESLDGYLSAEAFIPREEHRRAPAGPKAADHAVAPGEDCRLRAAHRSELYGARSITPALGDGDESGCLRESQPCVVMNDAAALFGTRGLVKIRGEAGDAVHVRIDERIG